MRVKVAIQLIMSTKEVRVGTFDFSGKQGSGMDGPKFLAWAKHRGQKEFLLWKKKVPMQEHLDFAEASGSESDKRNLKLGELNELTHKNIVFSIQSYNTFGQGCLQSN